VLQAKIIDTRYVYGCHLLVLCFNYRPNCDVSEFGLVQRHLKSLHWQVVLTKPQFLTDRVVAHCTVLSVSAIGILLSSVCPSVRPSVCLWVTLCIVAFAVGVDVEWKLYRRVPSTALPIHVLRHFCCRMYLYTAVTHSENRTAEISAYGITMGTVITWP